MDSETKYKLASDLNWNDLRIEIVDATGLSESSKKGRITELYPINGERIEYFVKQGNSLRSKYVEEL